MEIRPCRWTEWLLEKDMKIKPWITAHAIVREQLRIVTNTVRVPVSASTTGPTVPYIIKFEKNYYVRTNTNPLEYTSASFGKATQYGKR